MCGYVVTLLTLTFDDATVDNIADFLINVIAG